MFGGMGIGVDAAEEAFFGGFSPVSPVHVEALGVGVEFDDGVVGDSGVDDLLDVDVAGFPAQEEPSGDVAEHVDVGVFDGGDDALGEGLFVLGEAGVNGGNDVVELFEEAVFKVEFAVVEDVDFGAGEDVNFEVAGGIESADCLDLAGEPFFVESVGLEAGFGVVGDADIFPAFVLSGLCHFFKGAASVGGGGVVVEAASEVWLSHEFGEGGILSGGFDFALAFPHFGGDVLQAEGGEDVGFGIGGDGAFAPYVFLFFGGSQAPFAEVEAFCQGQLPHLDVVVFGAGKVVKGEEVLFRRNYAEVRLEAVFEPDAGFGVSMRGDFGNAFLRGEPGHDRGGVSGGDEEVEVSNGFHASAEAASGFGFFHLWQFKESGQDAVGDFPGFPPEVPGTVGFTVFDADEDFFLTFGAESFEGGDLVGLAGLGEAFDGVDAESFVEGFDFFTT